MSARVSIDGSIVAPREAVVSVFDHGFLYGDAVYETLRTYGGRPFLLPEHFARLGDAARTLGIPLPWNLETVQREIDLALEGAGDTREWLVRIILTRGVGALSPDPATCREPTRIVIVSPHQEHPPEIYRTGVSIAISSRRRDPAIASLKTGNLIHQVMGAQDAALAGVSEVIFLNKDGYLSDGTRSNLFLVRDGEILTPSEECGIVRGITRNMVIDVARGTGLDTVEGQFTPDLPGECSEAFLTSTTRGIMPVTRIDGREVGDGAAGPLTTRLAAAYRAAVQRRIETDRE
jgi:branched-chain amino acid aminotransferase